MRNHVSLFTAAILAAALLAVGPAIAGEGKDSVNFRFDRSALATSKGAATVYAAMRAHAENKCDPRGDKVRKAIEACSGDLIGQWVIAIDNERLSALHAAR